MSTLSAQQMGHVLDTLVDARKGNLRFERLTGLHLLLPIWKKRVLSGHTWRWALYDSDGGASEFEQTTGLEPWPAVTADGGFYFTNQPKRWGHQVIVSKMEVDELNDNQVGELLLRRQEAVQFNHLYRMWRRMLGHASTGFASLNTFNGVDNATGLLEHDAVGSQTNTVAGFVKSTYAARGPAQNQVADAAGAAGTLLYRQMLRAELNTSRYITNEMGDDVPVRGGRIGLLSPLAAEHLAASREGYNMVGSPGTDIDKGSTVGQVLGAMKIRASNIDWHIDFQLPVNGGATTATNPISGMIIDPSNLGMVFRASKTDPKAPRFFTGDGELRELSGFDVYQKRYYTEGQLMFGQPKGADGGVGTFTLATSALVMNAETY